jgi:riboflavin synthase
MFTGLIEGLGKVERLERQGTEVKLWIVPPWPAAEAVLGESVAVNGACLTVSRKGEKSFSAFVSGESLARTNLGHLSPGSKINLERALPLNGRLGGHLVSGHVDCLGQIKEVVSLGSSTRLKVTIPPEHMRYVAEKGSICLDGISLTVNQTGAGGFSVNIIPHTMSETTLHLVKVGQEVNVETDLLAKYVEKLLQPASGSVSDSASGLTFADLARLGF